MEAITHKASSAVFRADQQDQDTSWERPASAGKKPEPREPRSVVGLLLAVAFSLGCWAVLAYLLLR